MRIEINGDAIIAKMRGNSPAGISRKFILKKFKRTWRKKGNHSTSAMMMTIQAMNDRTLMEFPFDSIVMIIHLK